MGGTYWLTVLPDTSKLKPAINAAMRGQKITADFGVDEAKARKAGKAAAEAAEREANKSKPKVKPEADKAGSKKAGQDAAEEAAKPIRDKRPKVKPEPDLPGSKKAGEDSGASAVGGLMSKLKGIAPLLGGLSLAGGLQSALSEGMTFTENLNVMGGVLKATDAQLAQVSEAARRLGADATLPGVSATTAAQAMTELAKGGFDVQQSMDAARGTLQLAGAAGIDAASAATIQADALHAFGLTAKDAGYAADVLANVANASTGEITDFAQGFQQAGAVASQFGLKIDDTAAALGTLANQGIKGSDAGTLIKSTLLALTDQGKPAQGAIKELGLTVYNAQGQFVGMGSLMEQLGAAAGRMSPEMYQAATNTLFGSDAARLAGVAAKEGATGFNTLKDAVNQQGGAADMAAARTRGLPGAWAGFQNTIDGLKLSIYDMIQGPLAGLLNSLSGLPEFVSRNSTAFKVAGTVITTLLIPALTAWTIAQAKAIGTSIVGAVSALIGSWTAMAGAILNAAAAAGTYAIAIARGVATSIVSGLTAMVTAFRNLSLGMRVAAAAQWALNVAMSANPIGLIVAAVVAVGAALWAFFTKTETGRKLWDKIWTGIKTTFSVVWEWLKTAFQWLGEKLTWLWQNVAVPAFQGIKSALEMMWSGAKIIWDALTNAAQWLGDKISWLWQSIAVPAFEAIKGAIETMWNGAKVVWDGFTAILDVVGDKIATFKDAIVAAFNTVKDVVTTVWNAIGGIIDSIGNGVGKVGEFLGGAGKVIVNTLGIGGNATGGLITGPGSGTSDSILARLSNGEYVINAASTGRYLPLLEAINRGSLPGFAGGGLAASSKAAEGGLQGNSILVARLLAQMFPQIATIGGYRANGGGYADHPEGRAIDVMIPNYQSEDGIALGNAVTAFLHENADKLNLDYTIWRQTYRSASGDSNVMPARGSDTADHFDHVHATLKAGSPASYAIPSGLRLPAGLTNSMDGQGISSSLGGATSAGGTMSYRPATSAELSSASGKVDSANEAVRQAQQRVDDRTFNRDQAQKRLDAARAAGKDTTKTEEMLRRAERELADATDNLSDKRDKAAEAEQAFTDLQTNGKLEAVKADKAAADGTGKGGLDGSSLGQTFVSGVLESIGLDGSLFSNPLEWPSVKSLMAGVNYAGGLLANAGGAGGEGTGGGFASGAADAVGLGGLLSAIPGPGSVLDAQSGSPQLAPGEFNPGVAGGTASSAGGSMSAFAPHGGTAGAAPGPAVDNSININGPVGMDPAALQTKIRTEQASRTRTTVPRMA